MSIDVKQIQTVSEIANVLYDFLPGSPNPYADQSISFPGCAQKAGVGSLWRGGSKRPAITQLLRDTLDRARSNFCTLMLEIVKTGIIYRMNKDKPITREEIIALNGLIKEVGFKIPDLWDPKFLDGLPTSQPVEEPKTKSTLNLDALLREYMDIAKLEPHNRGYAFQDFLNKIFFALDLAPKSAFRITGEEIDGSFQVNNDTYLLEAKWQALQVSQKDLAAFSIKVSGKSTWARGLFISYSGFTKDGLEAFARGKQTNIIGMDAQDLYFILEGRMDLKDAIMRKARYAAETNNLFISVFDLANR